jgi:hypothetical protein
MLAALLVAAATAAPSPVASASPSPLKTIITVKSSTFCSQFVDHLNPAIASTLSNDTTLGSLVVTLKANGLAGTYFDRYREMQRLNELADSIYVNYRSGEAQVKELRALEAASTNPIEQAELKAAADALGGALYRQHLIQRDLDGFVAYLNAADMRRGTEGDDLMANTSDYPPGMHPARYDPEEGGLPPTPSPLLGGLPGDETVDQDAKWAGEAADDFITRFQAIHSDEVGAATYIDAVYQHC